MRVGLGMGLGSARGSAESLAAPAIASISPSIGFRLSAGLDLAIAGSGFTGATTATIDGVPCTDLVVADDTLLLLRSGEFASQGVKDVVVTGPGGSDTLTNGFRVAKASALWLRADLGVTLVSGKVATWADQSGNGGASGDPGASARPALSANSASFNNQATIDLDGTDDYLSGAIAINSANYALYAVLRFNGNATGGGNDGVFSAVASAASDVAATSLMLLRGSSTLLYTFQGGFRCFNTIANNVSYVVSTRFDGTNNLQRVNTTDALAVSVNAAVNTASYYLGARWNGGAVSQFEPMSVAELIAFPTDPTSGEDAIVRDYFLDRYAIASLVVPKK